MSAVYVYHSQLFTHYLVGATLSAPGLPVQVHILPGQYASNTNPQLIHDLLASSTTSLSSSIGFNVSSAATLPLNLQLQPGLATFTESLYSGTAAFAGLPSSPVGNNSVPLSAGSLALAPGVWAALQAESSRIILWSSVPDLSQLPIGSGQGYVVPLELVGVHKDLPVPHVNHARPGFLDPNANHVQVDALVVTMGSMDRDCA